MVVLGFMNNDISNHSYFVFDKETFIEENYMVGSIKNSFLKKIDFFELVVKNIYNRQKKRAIEEFDEKVAGDFVQENKRSFFQIINLTDKEGIPLLILGIPRMRVPFYSSHQEELLENARDQGITVIDVLELYKSEGDDWYQALRVDKNDPWHPDERGHELMAKSLFQEIIAET